MARFTPVVNEINLRAGLNRWDELAVRGNWPEDLHASMYLGDVVRLSEGLTSDWWHMIVRRLSAWRANRPVRNRVILDAGLQELPRIDLMHRTLMADRLSLETASWSDVAELFGAAAALKPTKSSSPVFGSKLCHFMVPGLFPVIDRAAVRWDVPYVDYWNACQESWIAAAADHHGLRSIVDTRVPEDARVVFPYATKITELCIVGERTGGI